METKLDISNLYNELLLKINSVTKDELFEAARTAKETSEYSYILDNDYFC